MTRPLSSAVVWTTSLALAAALAAGCGGSAPAPAPEPTSPASTPAPATPAITPESVTGTPGPIGMEGAVAEPSPTPACDKTERCNHRVEKPKELGYLLKWQKQLEDGTHEYVLSACFGKHASCPVTLRSVKDLEFELVHAQGDTADPAKLDSTSLTFTSAKGKADIEVTVWDGCPGSPWKIRNEQAPDFCAAGTGPCK